MKKKSNYLNLYKAYKTWKDTLKNDRVYKNYVKTLNLERNGANVLEGVIGKKLIDLAWVKQIEDTLPYMDNAIRDSRSFIEQKDEIVNIEKVKRVNTQSIRHLAQHTNLIAKVEDNGDVLPSKILNIFYESNFSIYENRFLYTLLHRLSDFIEERYQALINMDEKIEVNYQIEKEIKRKQGNAIVKLDIDYKTDGNTKRPSAKDDTSKLSGFERVIRIRNIVQDFFAATLIRNLKGIERVRSPIVRTNLMSKNVNFRTCLELWEYIERYKGPGYTYQNRSFDGNMPLPIKDNLQDTVIFGKFLTEITFNPEQEKELKKELNQEIREESKLQRQQLLLLESKAKDEQRKVGERALERAKQSFEKQVLKEKEKLEKEQEKSKASQERIEAKHQKTVQYLKLRNESHRQKRELLQTQKKALQQEKSLLLKEKREFQKEKRDLEKQQKVLLKAQKTLNDINAKKQEIRDKNQNKAKNEGKNTKKQQKTN